MDMKLKKRRIAEGFVLLVIAVTVIAGVFFYGKKKEGYHVDELYSYGLSNSEYLPFLHMGEMEYSVRDWMMEYGAGEDLFQLFRNLSRDIKILRECGFRLRSSEIYERYQVAQKNSADTYSTTWMDGQAYRDYLAVSPHNRFNYASVYYNQRGDVHPPLFYLILHTVCSFAPGVFSKWFGIGMNLAIGLVLLAVLYLFGKKHLGGSLPAVLLLLSYALSVGFMSTVLYIRMYMLLTLFTLLCCAVHLDIAESGFALLKKTCFKLALTVLGGYMTHYYFVLYAIGIALVFLIWMTVQKRWRAMLRYLVTLGIAAAAGICIWPFSVKHVFLGYRGRGTLEELRSGNFSWLKLEYMLRHPTRQLLGQGKWFFIALVAACLVFILWKKESRASLKAGKIAVVVVPVLLYTFLVSQIVPFFADRYLMNTYPFWCMGVVWSVCTAAAGMDFGKVRMRYFMPVAALAVLFVCNNFLTHSPEYLYTGGSETYEVPACTSCIYVLPDRDWNESSDELDILARCERVGVVYASNLAALADDRVYTERDRVLLIVRDGLDAESVLSDVQEILFDGALTELERSRGPASTRILLRAAP